MYRRTIPGQNKLDLPFGVELRTDNRWVQLTRIMPWEKIDQIYSVNFKESRGQIAKSSRLAFAALYIQRQLAITDEETVNQIQETPSMQYFCGFESYSTEKPFDSSLMVHFRKRLTAEMIKEISEEAFAAEAKKNIEKDEDDSDSDEGNATSGGADSSVIIEEKPKGTMLLDACCFPSDIHYPTDINLLNEAREITEQIIDELHLQLRLPGIIKPRTYREEARCNYLKFAKRRKYTYPQLRKGDYGTLKRKYGLDRVMAKLDETGFTTILLGFFVMNMQRLHRGLLMQPV